MDGFELELRAHPQASMRPSVSHDFDLWEGDIGNDECKAATSSNEWFPQHAGLLESCCSQVKRVFRARVFGGMFNKGKFGMSLLENGYFSQSQELLAET